MKHSQAELIQKRISELSEKLADFNVEYIYGDWMERSSDKEYGFNVGISNRITASLFKLAPKIDDRDIDSFLDVLLSNIYAVSQDLGENSDNKTQVLGILNELMSRTNSFELQKNTERENITNVSKALKDIKEGSNLINKIPEHSNRIRYPSYTKVPIRQKITVLKSSIEEIQKKSAISESTLDKLLEIFDDTLPLYLQSGLVISLLMLGKIHKTLQISLKLKSNYDVLVVISDYFQKIYEIEESFGDRFTKLSTNSIPPITILTPYSFKTANPKMFRIIEEISALTMLLSVFSRRDIDWNDKVIIDCIFYSAYKFNNSLQCETALQLLEFTHNNSIVSQWDLTSLYSMLYYNTERYTNEIEECVIKNNLSDNDKIEYLISIALLHKIGCNLERFDIDIDNIISNYKIKEKSNYSPIPETTHLLNIAFVNYCIGRPQSVISAISSICENILRDPFYENKSKREESLLYLYAFSLLEEYRKDKEANFSNLATAYESLQKSYAISYKNNDQYGTMFLRSLHFLRNAPNNYDKNWLECLYFIFLTFKTQDILSIHPDTLKKDEKICAYMSLERYKQNIVNSKDNKLPVLNAQYMNDPMEGKLLEINPNNPNKRYYSDPKVYIRAFTMRYEDLPMWDRYADDGAGVCVVLSREMFYRSVVDLNAKEIDFYFNYKIWRLEDSYSLYRVAYLDDVNGNVIKIVGRDTNNYSDQYGELNNLVIDIKALAQKLLKNGNDEIKEIVNYYFNRIKYLFKSNQWESEDEVRLVSFSYDDRENFELKDRNIHYVLWRKPIKINEVIVGPKVKDFLKLIPYLEESIAETQKSIINPAPYVDKTVSRSRVVVV